jgi:hypothetical protein
MKIFKTDNAIYSVENKGLGRLSFAKKYERETCMSEWEKSSDSSCSDMEETISRLGMMGEVIAKTYDVKDLDILVNDENHKIRSASEALRYKTLWSILIAALKRDYSKEFGSILNREKVGWEPLRHDGWPSEKDVYIDRLEMSELPPGIRIYNKEHVYDIIFLWTYRWNSNKNETTGTASMRIPFVEVNGETYYGRPKDIELH